LDSKPYSESLVDRWTESVRSGSEIIASRVARTIEQGLGRSVRGEKDYSVIILIGPDLIKIIRTKASRGYFSPQTRAQIELGLEIAEFQKEDLGNSSPEAALNVLIGQCLRREEGWKDFYAVQMSAVGKPSSDARSLTLFVAEHKAETEFQQGNVSGAIETIQELVDKHIRTESEKGWYLQEMARYAYLQDKAESNRLQLAAHQKNRFLLKPRDGMKITNISAVGHKRLEKIIKWSGNFENAEELTIEVEDILGRLRFGVAADSFEKAVDELGQALGFETQRPDKEWKQGPDNLWALRDGQYLLVECKNKVDKNRTEINKDETGQMNSSCAWFKKHYGDMASKNLMIIWTRTVGPAGGFNEPVEIVTDPLLARLTRNVRDFFRALRTADLKSLSAKSLQTNLEAYHLTTEDLLTIYSEKPKQL
jgi:hypothetical protein